MGIKKLSKLVEATSHIKYDQLRRFLITQMESPEESPCIAIDAANLIYRASTWQGAFKMTNAAVKKEGEDEICTGHLKVILAFLRKLAKLDIDCIWVFDHLSDGSSGEFHLQLKSEELQRRSTRKQEAKAKLKELEAKGDATESQLHAKKCEAFSLNETTIKDVQYMLTKLGIRWITASAGYEGEQICAQLTWRDADQLPACQAVLSDDMDCIAYGANALLRRVPKSKSANKIDADFAIYEFAKVLKSLQKTRDEKLAKKIKKNKDSKIESKPISREEFITMCIMLGSDLADKTPRAGPSTIFNLLHRGIELTAEQKKAAEQFLLPRSKVLDLVPESNQSANSSTTKLSIIKADIAELINWLVDERGFTRKSIAYLQQIS